MSGGLESKQLAQAAHALKGSTGAIGTRRASELCRLLEDMGKSGTAGEAAELIAAWEDLQTKDGLPTTG